MEKQEQKQITFDILNEIKYQKLPSFLNENGLGRAWKQGGKKKDIIASAMSILAFLDANDPKRELQGEELEKALDKFEADKKLAKEEAEIKRAQEAKDQDMKVIENVKKVDLSKDDIRKNLVLIEANLRNGVPAHNHALQLKRIALTQMLAEMEEEEELVVGKGDQ